MPKMKTNRATAKRFRKTGRGKYRRQQSHHNHILTKKSSKRKRHLRDSALIDKSDEHRMRRLLPYS